MEQNYRFSFAAILYFNFTFISITYTDAQNILKITNAFYHRVNYVFPAWTML